MKSPTVSSRLKIFSSPHFWAVVILFAICIVLHYPQQLVRTGSPSVFSFLGLTRHAAERILLLFPITYTAFVFGTRAGFMSLAVATVIMLPRVFLISQYVPDSLFETTGVIFIGALVNMWSYGYRKDKRQQQGTLAKLEQAYWELRLSEQRYRELFESAHDAIWVHDLDGNLLAVNRACEELAGCSSAELLKMNVMAFLTEESANLAKRVRQMLSEGKMVEQPYEQHWMQRNGSQAVLKLTSNLLKKDGQTTGFLHIARNVTLEKEMQDKLAAAYRDLTESHQRLKESQEQLIQAEKLTSLGQLAASVAHEVNNPLTGVLVYTQLMIKRITSGDLSREASLEYLRKMEAEVIRSTKLIRNLLDFARQSPPAFRQVDLNEVLNRSYDLAAHSAALQHVQAIKELDSSLPTLLADSDQLQQVCTNLIMNAIEAMPGGGTLTMRTCVDKDDVIVEMRDTGCGISPQNMLKLFTPFFTTKREVKGVGLGLAVSHGIVQRHKGRIDVQSEVGQGTTFRLCLPLHPGERQEKAAALPEAK